MSEAFVSVNGHRVIALKLLVPNVGPWAADLDFDAAPELTGRVTLKVDALELQGTVDPARSGDFGLQKRMRIIGGAGAWSSPVKPKQYHADNGVKTRLVAEDAAREVGESIGTFIPASERIGWDYVRQQGPASRALDDARGGVAWWVDYAGMTHVGPRPSTALDESTYSVLAFDPRDNIATLAVDDPAAVRVGSVLTEGLDGPHTVRYFELSVTKDEMRVRAWCGGTEAGYGHVAGVLRAIALHFADSKLSSLYRYRVVRMALERIELQAVSKAPGLPDLLPISAWPGIAGAHANLRPGAEVLVAFVEGSRAQPVVVAFAGADKAGFVPLELVLGGTSGPPAARQGDVVEVQLPPATFTGTMGVPPATTPITGAMVFSPAKALGLITSGSGKVKVAT